MKFKNLFLNKLIENIKNKNILLNMLKIYDFILRKIRYFEIIEILILKINKIYY